MFVFDCFLDDYNKIVAYLSLSYHKGISEKFYLRDDSNNLYELKVEGRYEGNGCMKYVLVSPFDLCVGKKYFVLDDHHFPSILKYRGVCQTSRFDDEFYYDGDLGVSYLDGVTTFKIWAPTASKVTLRLDKSYFDLFRCDKGVW